MQKDNIVQEVRKIRKEIENEYANNFEEYYLHIKSFQKKLGKRLVRLKPNTFPAVKKENQENYELHK